MRDWPPSVQATYARAVFLDRDGTIIKDTHYPHRIEDMEFIPQALSGLSLLSKKPIQIIVVSNQAGIALGLFTEEQMSNFNARLKARVEDAGGRIDAFYYCPELEPKHLAPGERRSSCAKPSPAMLLEAAKDFNLDLTRSFMVGDKLSDIAAGQSAGCFTLLVQTGKAGHDPEEQFVVSPDHVAENLSEAAKFIARQLE